MELWDWVDFRKLEMQRNIAGIRLAMREDAPPAMREQQRTNLLKEQGALAFAKQMEEKFKKEG